jgi:hypothetical protein
MEGLMSHSGLEFAWSSDEVIYRLSLHTHRSEYLCLPLKWSREYCNYKQTSYSVRQATHLVTSSKYSVAGRVNE